MDNEQTKLDSASPLTDSAASRGSEYFATAAISDTAISPSGQESTNPTTGVTDVIRPRKVTRTSGRAESNGLNSNHPPTDAPSSSHLVRRFPNSVDDISIHLVLPEPDKKMLEKNPVYEIYDEDLRVQIFADGRVVGLSEEAVFVNRIGLLQTPVFEIRDGERHIQIFSNGYFCGLTKRARVRNRMTSFSPSWEIEELFAQNPDEQPETP